MKKFAVIGVSLLAALAVLTYVFSADHSDDAEDTNEDAPAETRGIPSDDPTAAAHAPEATVEEQERTVEEAIARIAPENYRHESMGAETDFRLFGGEIGYVDADSILQDRDPYSIVALLQQHRAISGAGELLELEIESTGETHRGYSADFVQVIGGTSTEARGSVGFYTSGAVYALSAELLDPEAARVGNIVILQAEAEAIAHEAAARFVEPRRGPFVESNETLIVDAEVKELRYNLVVDDASRIRAEWLVWVSTYYPFDEFLISIDTETGEVVDIERTLKHRRRQSNCPSVKFRVCDGSTATRESCNSTTLPNTTIYGEREDETWGCVLRDENGNIDETKCNESEYARHNTALANARDVMDYVCSISGEYLEGVGRDGVVDILVDAPESLVDKGDAEFSSRTKAILLGGIYREKDWSFDPATDKATVTHEAIHAITKGGGSIEEGLVYSMEALHMGGQDGRWEAGARRQGQVIYQGNEQDVAGNAIYRIYKRVGANSKDEVFRFALEVGKKKTTSLYGFRRVLVEVAEDQFSEAFQQAVAAVLVEMGINDAVAGTVSITMLEFIAAKMRDLALIVGVEDRAWVSAAAEEAEREIRRRLGLDDDQVLRNSRRRGG